MAEGDSSVVYIRFLKNFRSREFVEESVMLAEVDAMVRVINITLFIPICIEFAPSIVGT